MTLSLTFGSGDAVAHVETILRDNLQTYLGAAYTARGLTAPTLQADSIRRGDDENAPLTQTLSIHILGTSLTTTEVVSRHVSTGHLSVQVCAYVGLPTHTNTNDPTTNSTQDDHAWAVGDAIRACLQAHAPSKAVGVVAALHSFTSVESVERGGFRPSLYRKTVVDVTLETRIRAGHNRKL